VPSTTVADSISVDIPRNFFMTRNFMQQNNGEAITVSDEEILAASALLSKNTGLFAEPAAVTAFAGLLSYRENGKIPENSVNVVLLTGSGLKDLKAVNSMVKMPESILPSIEELKKILS
jgi:threonine synthase